MSVFILITILILILPAIASAPWPPDGFNSATDKSDEPLSSPEGDDDDDKVGIGDGYVPGQPGRSSAEGANRRAAARAAAAEAAAQEDRLAEREAAAAATAAAEGDDISQLASMPCRTPLEESAPRSRCVPDPNARRPEWAASDEYSPFINPRTCEYSIVVDKVYDGNLETVSGQRKTKQYESLGSVASVQRRNRLEEYFTYGVDRLIEYYIKDRTLNVGGTKIPTYLRNLATEAHEQATERGENRIKIPIRPSRPGLPAGKVKVLVAIPYEEFNDVAQSYDPNDHYLPTDIAYKATYDIRTIKAQIEYTSKIITEHYGKMSLGGIDIFGFKADFGSVPRSRGLGETRNLDLIKEASKMNGFLTALQDLLTENEIDINLNLVEAKQEYLEVIMGSEFNLLDIKYIQHNGEKEYLRVGWPKMIDRSTSRSNALIYWTQSELFQMFNNHVNPSWEGFVRRYIYPPIDTNMTIGSRLDRDRLNDLNTGLDVGMQAAAAVLGFFDLAGDITSNRQSLMPLADSLIKTQAELRLENDDVLNQLAQSNLTRQVQGVSHQADSLFPGIDWSEMASGAVGAVGDHAINLVYNNVLHHVDYRYIVAKILACLGVNFGDADCFGIDPLLCELIKKITDMLLMLANMDYSTFDLDWLEFLEALSQDITGALVTFIFNFIINAVNMLLTSAVVAILEMLDKLCSNEFDYASINLDGLLAQNFANPGAAANFFGALTDSLGDGTAAADLLKQLLRDISAVLSTSELCALLQGSATTEVLRLVHNIILLEKYSAFHSQFESLKDVSTFFSAMGKVLDPSICQLGSLIPGTICEDGFNETLRRSLLAAKEGITDEEIEEQINNERDRRREIMQELSDMFADGPSGLSDKMSAIIKNGEIARAVTDHPVSREAVNQVVQATFFNPIEMIIREGLGTLETPYNMVGYEASIGPDPLPKMRLFEIFPFNRGIMHLISDELGSAGFRNAHHRVTNDKNIVDGRNYMRRTSPDPSSAVTIHGRDGISTRVGSQLVGVANLLPWMTLNLRVLPRAFLYNTHADDAALFIEPTIHMMEKGDAADLPPGPVVQANEKTITKPK